MRITREGDTAIIEYANSTIRGVHLRIGPALETMTVAEVLNQCNDMLEVQAELAVNS